jgi:hypothetical protein
MWAKGSFTEMGRTALALISTDHLSETLQAGPIASPRRLLRNAIDSQTRA